MQTSASSFQRAGAEPLSDWLVPARFASAQVRINLVSGGDVTSTMAGLAFAPGYTQAPSGVLLPPPASASRMSTPSTASMIRKATSSSRVALASGPLLTPDKVADPYPRADARFEPRSGRAWDALPVNTDELTQSIDRCCRLTGDFTLRSGQASREYFDKYRFESDPLLLRQVAEAMVPLVPSDTDLLGGLELGGIPIVTVLSSLTEMHALFVRKEAKTYGTCRLAEGADVAGRRITLVEDVLTTGGAVGGGTGEQATAVDVHRQEPDEQGDQRDHQRPEEDDEGDGGRDVLVLAVDGPLDRGDGRRATDREAGGDEQPLSHGHPQESPNGQRAEDPAADDGHDDDQQARAEGGDLWKKNMEFSTGKADSVPFSVVQNDCRK